MCAVFRIRDLMFGIRFFPNAPFYPRAMGKDESPLRLRDELPSGSVHLGFTDQVMAALPLQGGECPYLDSGRDGAFEGYAEGLGKIVKVFGEGQAAHGLAEKTNEGSDVDTVRVTDVVLAGHEHPLDPPILQGSESGLEPGVVIGAAAETAVKTDLVHSNLPRE